MQGPTQEAPVIDERATPTYKAARLAVIILSGLIILALIGLVVGSVTHLSGKPAHAPQNAYGTHFALPRGAKLLEMQSQPGRLLLHVRSAEGDEIEIIDTEDGHLVSSVKASHP